MLTGSKMHQCEPVSPRILIRAAERLACHLPLAVGSDLSLVRSFLYKFKDNFQLSHRILLQKYKDIFFYRKECKFSGNFKTPLPIHSVSVCVQHMHAHKSSARKWNISPSTSATRTIRRF